MKIEKCGKCDKEMRPEKFVYCNAWACDACNISWVEQRPMEKGEWNALCAEYERIHAGGSNTKT